MRNPTAAVVGEGVEFFGKMVKMGFPKALPLTPGLQPMGEGHLTPHLQPLEDVAGDVRNKYQSTRVVYRRCAGCLMRYLCMKHRVAVWGELVRHSSESERNY